MIGSATLTGNLAGTAILHATKAGLTSTDSGTITVAAGTATVALNPISVSGVSPSIGTVTLSSPAPAGGTVVTLSSSNTSLATVPASVTVAAGTMTKTFTVTPKRVYTTSYVTIKAIISGVSYTAKLTLTTSPLLASFTVPSLTVTGNSGSTTGTVGLANIVTNPIDVMISSSWPAVVIPAIVTVPANQSSATFPISIPDLSGFTSATLTATLGSVSKQATLTVLVTHITAPVGDGGTYTYRASAPVGFNGYAQTINNQPLDYRWVPYDPANAGGQVIVFPVRRTSRWCRLRRRCAWSSPWPGLRSPRSWTQWTLAPGLMPGTCGWQSINLVPDRSCPAPSPNLLFPTVTGLTDFLSGSPPSISATLFQASDRYSWALEQENPVGSGHVHQCRRDAECGSGERRLRPGESRVDAEARRQRAAARGALSAAVPRRAAQRQLLHTGRLLAVLSLQRASTGPNLLGLSPSPALAGDANLILYGTGLDATMSISLAGPVYALADTSLTNPLCNLSTGTCPLTTLLASFGSNTLSFALPSSLSTGYYLVRSRTSSGTLSIAGKWLRVDPAAKSFPVLPPNQHNMSNRILPGQTITGTFAEGGDTTGIVGDYNTYYFFATAGSVFNASVTRVDESKPWEDPSAIDPQVRIISPDGLVYDNLFKADDQPGVDYNASLSGAVLPMTGTYYLRAETLKGSGAYAVHDVLRLARGRARRLGRSRSSETTTPPP